MEKKKESGGKKMNNVGISGRLTRDADIRVSQSGATSARFTVAVDRTVKRNDTWEKEPDFIGCVAFGKTAEFIEKYFRKGSFIIIPKASIKTGRYEKDGQTIYTTDVFVEKVEFGGGNNENSNSGGQASQTSNNDFVSIPSDVDSDEIPFL